MSAENTITQNAPQSFPQNPQKQLASGCDVYGKQRLQLALIVRDYLTKHRYNWFLDAGSLLGAWRNGKLIQHDDDLDLSVYFDHYNTKYTAHEQLVNLQEQMSSFLPSPYKCRAISTYCEKLEVFDPTYGKYALIGKKYNGADFHHVTVDVQVFTELYKSPNNNNIYRSSSPDLNELMITSLYYSDPITVPYDMIFPCQIIKLEGEEFVGPRDLYIYLVELYDYVGEDCEFDAATGKYRKYQPQS